MRQKASKMIKTAMTRTTITAIAIFEIDLPFSLGFGVGVCVEVVVEDEVWKVAVDVLTEVLKVADVFVLFALEVDVRELVEVDTCELIVEVTCADVEVTCAEVEDTCAELELETSADVGEGKPVDAVGV